MKIRYVIFLCTVCCETAGRDFAKRKRSTEEINSSTEKCNKKVCYAEEATRLKDSEIAKRGTDASTSTFRERDAATLRPGVRMQTVVRPS